MMMILGISQDPPSSSRYILLPTSTFHLGADLPLHLSQNAYHPRCPHHPRPRHLRTGSMHGHNLRTHRRLLSLYARHLLLDLTLSSSWLIRLLLSQERRTRRKAHSDSDLVDGAKRMRTLGLVGRRAIVVEVKRSIILGNHRGYLYHIACLYLHYCLLPTAIPLIAVIRLIYN
jgi:hypothetical protein